MTLLDEVGALDARLARMGERHVAALAGLRGAWAADGRAWPCFDPADGGVGARVLLLLETPGPGHSGGGQIVSMDNRSGTGRNLRRFVGEAGLARADLVIWNAVPWVVHGVGAKNRAVTRAELREGLALLPAFLERLPRLRAAVLMGRSAGAARPVIAAARPEVALFETPHPSPTIVCTSPVVGERIAAGLAAAARLCAGS